MEQDLKKWCAKEEKVTERIERSRLNPSLKISKMLCLNATLSTSGTGYNSRISRIFCRTKSGIEAILSGTLKCLALSWVSL